MHPRRSLRRPLPFLLLPALSFGCFEEEPIAGMLPDAGLDASTPDASNSDPADAGAGPIACDAAHPCAGDAVCAPEGVCAPRCDADAGCWIASTSRQILELVVDGETLYFLTAPSHDQLGNALGDGKIWRLPAEGPAEVLLNDLGAPQHLVDTGDHLMWHGGGKLRRAAKAAPSIVEPLYATGCGFALPLQDSKLAVQAPGGLFVGSADGTAPLVKVSDAADFDGETDDAQLDQCVRLHLADQTVFRARPVPRTEPGSPYHQAIVGVDLRTNAETTYAARTYGEDPVFAVVPPYFYEVQNMYFNVYRAELTGDRQNVVTVVRIDDGFNARAQLKGPWVYVAAPHFSPSKVVSLVRNSLAPPVQIQPLVPEGSFTMPTGGFITALAVSDRAMFIAIVTPAQSWVYRQPLPAN
ncbi:MAG: hypothetical protein ABW252_06945 [Polyangiales bacterium]